MKPDATALRGTERAFWAAADAAWEALPGTEAGWYSFRPDAELGDAPREVIRCAIATQRHDGATFWRVTRVDDGVWIEGWSQQPRKQADFNPPMTLSA